MQPFTKPALSSNDLVNLLQKRNLIVPDLKRAQAYLDNIGYYRLSSYFIPFQESQDRFKKSVSFDDILDLYIFDRKLRLLAPDAVQRVEIAVRTAISNHMSIKYDPFWMLNEKFFRDKIEYGSFLDMVKEKAGSNAKRLSSSCSHYYDKYGDRELPPSWITIEELSMGTWSKLFSNLKNKKDKNAIADLYQIDSAHFGKWLQSVTILRNALAHHRRFWNTTFPFRPPALQKYAQGCGNITGSYENFVIIMRLFKYTMNTSSWPERLEKLVEESCPFDYHVCMDFPLAWREMPFWN